MVIESMTQPTDDSIYLLFFTENLSGRSEFLDYLGFPNLVWPQQQSTHSGWKTIWKFKSSSGDLSEILWLQEVTYKAEMAYVFLIIKISEPYEFWESTGIRLIQYTCISNQSCCSRTNWDGRRIWSGFNTCRRQIHQIRGKQQTAKDCVRQ